MIKFTGKFSELKSLGFRFLKLYDNQIFYTTFETECKANVWIRKVWGIVSFDGYNSDTSEEILKILIDNNFDVRGSQIVRNLDTDHYHIMTPYCDSMLWMEWRLDNSVSSVRDETIAFLKILWESGLITVVSKEF